MAGIDRHSGARQPNPHQRLSQARQSTISGLENGQLAAHICVMRKVHVGMPMVEVTAPDGSKSLWAAAVAPGSAVDAVKKMIPPNHLAILSNRRLPIGPQTEGV